MATWIRWMLVLSSGSRKPEARPMATTFLFHCFLRRPVTNRRKRGSACALPSSFSSSTRAASSSLIWPLQ
jgi:hypothetical protein